MGHEWKREAYRSAISGSKSDERVEHGKEV
jgi:hypothetical protein